MQLQKSFKLRESINTPIKKKLSLTRPRSPTFHTNERMKLKDDFSMHEDSANKN
jgi:hypothetical protein